MNKIFYNFKKHFSTANKLLHWNQVEEPTPDPILGIMMKFIKSLDNRKVNLSIGTYKDENGNPYVFNCVKKASNIIVQKNMDNEYYAQGIQPFLEEAVKLAYGQDFVKANKSNIAKAQTVSGTGAVRLAFTFIKKLFPRNNTIYLPNLTWPNHNQIIEEVGLQYKVFSYYDTEKSKVDEEKILDELKEIPENQIILLHGCCHNPTGSDLSAECLKQIADIALQKNHLILFDLAYQGLASGNLDEDAYAVRMFANAHVPIILTQSFSKNMGLYGQRAGLISMIAENSNYARNIEAQFLNMSRQLWGMAPIHGARQAAIVMKTPELYQEWKKEINHVTSRLKNVRKLFVEELEKTGSDIDWSYIEKQNGIFSLVGLSQKQCRQLIDEHQIFLLENGRINVAALNKKNVGYVAKCFHEVSRNK